MSLEQDIKQAKFRNEHHKASINIIYTYNWVMERQKALFDAENITPQQFNILRILRGSAPRPISTLQIRERMLDRMSDTSRIVDRLVLKGLAGKKTCTSDKRLVDISITDTGLKLLQRLDAKNAEMDATLGALSEDEVKTLNILLDKIRKPD
ncbi:MAG: MarR family transcriptional regulator [Sphingobacteriales bacterium]|nr:MarR family transcriptional regulator [Sphingobacteriales bacterium]OJY92545.1 MAG: MarR family transcriptional regulator [Sphingobacteriales bacterium 44-15]